MGVGPRPRLARFLPVYHGSGGLVGLEVLGGHSFRSTNWSWWCLLRRMMQHWTGSAAGAGRPVVVEAVAVAGSAALLVGRGNSLMTEFRSLHFLHGHGAVAGRRCEPLRCAASCELRAAAPRCSGLVAPSGTRGMGNRAAVKHF